ncbi:MAG TPA: hypothetical protein VIJ51_05390 [Solirubrobacteraceae bacterium]
MNDFLDRLEKQLVAAASAPRHATPACQARHRRRNLRLPLLAALVLLVSATIALASSGLLAGSPVPASGPANPQAGEGIPVAGGSRLLSLRVADPEGGPPWGLRLIHTTRGLVCLQVGRVEDGELGELGIDGAFHDDGRFHPLPASELPTDSMSGAAANSSCVLAGQTFEGTIDGIDRSAASTASGAGPAGAPESTGSPGPTGHRRAISYGMLGAHALGITYDLGAGSRTATVIPGSGAYLLVEAEPSTQPGETYGGRRGVDAPNALRPTPSGALSAISYRFGAKVCSDGTGVPSANRCPRPAGLPRARPPRLANLHRPVHVTLEIRHGLIYGAELEFTAPYAVTSAREGYGIAMPISGTGDTIGGSIDHDIARGAIVRDRLPYVFANTPVGRSQLIEVLFTSSPTASDIEHPTGVIIGTATIREPPGTRPALPPVPHHARPGVPPPVSPPGLRPTP